MPVEQHNGFEVPVLRKSEVVHVGTMNPADKGRTSYEGHGLSVSQCPESWELIARLGGNPWWSLNKKGARFLDFHKARQDKTLMAKVTEWAKSQGLVVDAELYTVEWYDEELDDTVQMIFTDRAKAEYELDGREGEDYTPHIGAIKGVLHTAKAAGMMCWDKIEPSSTTDAMLVLFAQHCGLEGVWWCDRHDPAALSAPRGVILPSKLAGWTAEQWPSTSH